MTTQTKKLTDKELAAIEKRAEAATPGPWTFHFDRWDKTAPFGPPRRGVGWVDTDDVDLDRAQADLAFIAHARQDVPALLSALREAREREQQLLGLLATGFSEREAAEIAMRYQRECVDAAHCRIPGPPDLPGVIRVVREARAALKGGG